jgi:hypothetical protein
MTLAFATGSREKLNAPAHVRDRRPTVKVDPQAPDRVSPMFTRGWLRCSIVRSRLCGPANQVEASFGS